MFSRNRNRHKASKPPEEPMAPSPFDAIRVSEDGRMTNGGNPGQNGATYDLNAASKGASKGAESAKPVSEQQLPWSPGDIKEMLGFDRNDPRVNVRIVPMGTPLFEGEPVRSPFEDRLFDFDSGGTPNDGVTATVIDAAGIAAEVVHEIGRAVAKHGSQNSPHEGYAILLEELDELWAEIKADRGRSDAARKEAIQVAAMAIRYIMDNID